jgi:hypothetical protein
MKTVAFLLSVFCLPILSCYREHVSVPSDEERQIRQREEQQARERAEHDSSAKADAEADAKKVEAERQKVAKFLESVQPAMTQFRSMQLLDESRLSLHAYRKKLGAITGAFAGIGTPPDEQCKSVVDALQKAMEAYNAAQEPLLPELRDKNRLERFGMPESYPNDKTMREVQQVTLDAYERGRDMRLKLWSEAEANVERAAKVIESLQEK